MGPKQEAAKKALNNMYLDIHEVTATNIKNKVLDAFDEIKENTIREVQMALLQNMKELTFENGFSVDAIPKNVIDDLPTLMKEFYKMPYRTYGELSYRISWEVLMDKFPPEFKEIYNSYDATVHSVFNSLLNGANIYDMLFQVLKSNIELHKVITKAITRAIPHLPPFFNLFEDESNTGTSTTHNAEGYGR